jgi:hypothetical protein
MNPVEISTLSNGNFILHVPMSLKTRYVTRTIIMPNCLDGATGESRQVSPDGKNEPIIKVVVRAFAWARLLEEGTYRKISDLAAALKVDTSYVRRILRLSTLPPAKVEAILSGSDGGISLARFCKEAGNELVRVTESNPA